MSCAWTLPFAGINSNFCGELGVEGKIVQSAAEPLTLFTLNTYNART